MADAAPPDESNLPAADCDLLRGIGGIAKWLGWSRGQVRAAVDCGELPTFRSRAAVFAFKSAILQSFREIARRPGAGACAKSAPRKRKATAEDAA